jgi:TMEM175 potassium channel family protein
VLWANLHLLFWLSLVPVVTSWVGQHSHSQWPAVAYGAVGFLAGVAYTLLAMAISSVNKDTAISQVLQRDYKGRISLAFYAVGMALAFVQPLLAYVPYALVSIMWFIPDRRFAASADTRD